MGARCEVAGVRRRFTFLCTVLGFARSHLFLERCDGLDSVSFYERSPLLGVLKIPRRSLGKLLLHGEKPRPGNLENSGDVSSAQKYGDCYRLHSTKAVQSTVVLVW